VDSSTGKKYMPHGDITEVTYLSDGKFLNSTLWINDYINLDNPLYPEGIDIARYPNKKESLDRFMDNFIEDQISMMKSKGDILTAEYNKSNNKNVPFGNETALKSEITITRNNPSKTEEKFLMIFVKHKSDIYQFSFSSLSHRYEDLLDEIENVTKSFHFVNTDQSASLQNRDNLYKNNDLGISFEYSPNYTIIDKPWGITILFPSNNFQLISRSYGMLIDVDSIYDNGIDYIKRIWFDRLNNTWKETLYETKIWEGTELSERIEMVEGIVRTIEDKKFTNFPTNILNKLARQVFYVTIPLNLQHLNYPSSYDIYFVTFSSYEVDNKTCTVLDTTSFTPIPPPKMNITLNPNLLELRPEENKSVEIKINPSTRLPYKVNVTSVSNNLIKSTFAPYNISDIQSGLFRTTLTINCKKNCDTGEFPKYISWPINATISIEPSHNDIISNRINKNNLSSTTSSIIYLPVKINPPLYPIDYLKSAAAEIASPLGTIMTTLGVIVGSIVGISKWFLSQKKVKEDEKKDDIWY
jgi:hypothetical protein